MYQILTPKFRFALYVSPGQKHLKIEPGKPLICFADSYEIKEDGSIVFYQTGENQEKKFKLPVLTYPHGKWDCCLLLDDENEHPVFQGEFSIPEVIYTDQEPPEEQEEQSNPFTNGTHPNTEDLNFDDLDAMVENVPDPAIAKANEQLQKIIAAQNNPTVLRKLKIEWLEDSIKAYCKEQVSFNVEEFLDFISEKPQNDFFHITDMEIIWAASNLILDKMILTKKFSNELTQKNLALILPPIMQRQWDGKMAPILEVLEDREETKYVNAIDLAVWMVQHNFNT